MPRRPGRLPADNPADNRADNPADNRAVNVIATHRAPLQWRPLPLPAVPAGLAGH